MRKYYRCWSDISDEETERGCRNDSPGFMSYGIYEDQHTGAIMTRPVPR